MSSGGVEVAVHDLGGHGEPLVLAHAAGFHAHVWEPLAVRLREAFHCYGLDFRGHGDSRTPPGTDFAWNGLADDAAAAVAGLGLDRPWGVGHSSGATALLLAEAARPATFRALYCYEPVIFPPASADAAAGIAEALTQRALRREDFPSAEAAHDHYRGRGAFATVTPETLQAYVGHGLAGTPDGVRLKCRPGDEAAVYRMAPHAGAFSRLPAVGCRVQLVCGALTDAFGPAQLRILAAELPRAEVEVLVGLHHFGPLEDPDSVAASIVRAFGHSSSWRGAGTVSGPPR